MFLVYFVVTRCSLTREKNLEVEFEATPGFHTLGILTHVRTVSRFALLAGSR